MADAAFRESLRVKTRPVAVLWHAQQAAVRHLMSVAKPTLGMQCVQAPMAFAGFHGSTDESQLVQPPLAFSGRSRTHRLVEVGPAAPLLSALTYLLLGPMATVLLQTWPDIALVSSAMCKAAA